jgi:hypothetical protein
MSIIYPAFLAGFFFWAFAKAKGFYLQSFALGMEAVSSERSEEIQANSPSKGAPKLSF